MSTAPASARSDADEIELAGVSDPSDPKDESQKSSSSALQSRVLLLVLGHAVCASGMLVVSKWALKVFPFVWTLTTIQFLFPACVVFLAGKLAFIEVDPLDLTKLRKFFPAAGMFFITITAGNAVVKASNVDTFIVMRSLVPIPCAILESLVLKEPCPAPLSWIGLGIVLLGAIAYSMLNRGFVVNSVSWVVLFLALMPLDGILIKHLVSASGLSPWGLVLYNNACAALPGMLFSALLELSRDITREEMWEAAQSSEAKAAIIISSFMALAISYFQLNVRKVISSTAFMVLGVSNKLLSVLMNQVTRLDTNDSFSSIASVCGSIVGAIFFQQTVKGSGISLAPKQDSVGNESLACVLVVLGLLVAAKISVDSNAA